MIGDWMGSRYDFVGRRYDYRLLLDCDGHFERTVRCDPDYERHDTGRWLHDEREGVLHLESDAPNDEDRISSRWRVLSVSTCESSNVILVLQWLALASRNLPLLLYRVHCDRRAYGTDGERRLGKSAIAADERCDPESR